MKLKFYFISSSVLKILSTLVIIPIIKRANFLCYIQNKAARVAYLLAPNGYAMDNALGYGRLTEGDASCDVM